MMPEPQLWSGWPLVEAGVANGGSEARAVQRLMQKRRHQQKVIALLQRTHPELTSGVSRLKISPAQVTSWVDYIYESGRSFYAVKDGINFLSLGLERGKAQLDWDVAPPAPIQVLHTDKPRFSAQEFRQLQTQRSLIGEISSKLDSTEYRQQLHQGNGKEGHRTLTAEMISWGTLLFLVLDSGALCSSRYLYALPLSVNSLSIKNKHIWLTLFEDIPEKIRQKVPPRYRWQIDPQAQVILLHHLQTHGAPDVSDFAEAKSYTNRAWLHFSRAIGATSTLEQCIKGARIHNDIILPPFLADYRAGRLGTTSLPEARWRQLLHGGRRDTHSENSCTIDLPTLIAEQQIETKDRLMPPCLDKSAQHIRGMLSFLNQRRGEARHSHKTISDQLTRAATEASELAPIVECLCLWMLHLHQRKLKPSTLSKYLSTAGRPLLLEWGVTPVTTEQISELAATYHNIIESGQTPQHKESRRIILRLFHGFLVNRLGLPDIAFGQNSDALLVRHQADANLISEQEYQQISRILLSEQSSLGSIRYWAFVLGFRAGLRIGEVLSLQVRDVLLPTIAVDHSELLLTIRSNKYVSVKSSDSRRALPLHLLLTKPEKQAFEVFVRQRQELAQNPNVMLLRESHDAVSPLHDAEVQGVIHSVMRTLTGDHSLRYHHLRHSLANYLLLALFDVKPPWSAPRHFKGVFAQLLKDSPAGLHLISQLMGHASPSTTLKSYIHCLDLLTGKSGEPSITPWLSRLGIKQDLVRQWRRRYQSQWIIRQFPTVEGYIDTKESITTYPDPDQLPPVSSVNRSLHTLSLRELEHLLNSARQRTADQVESIFMLWPGALAALEHCHARITNVPTRNRSRTYRHLNSPVTTIKGHFVETLLNIPPPPAERDKDYADEIFAQLQHDLICDKDQALARAHLMHFHRYHRGHEGHIQFHDATTAVSFIQWLYPLARGILFQLAVTTASRSASTSKEQLTHLRRLLSGQQSRVDIVHKGSGSRVGDQYGSAQLKLVSKQPDQSPRRGYALRYALLWGCIVAMLTAPCPRHPGRKEKPPRRAASKN